MQENTLNEGQTLVKEATPAQSKFQVPDPLRKIFSHPFSNLIENLREAVRTKSSVT
jgi:hypothetical protein